MRHGKNRRIRTTAFLLAGLLCMNAIPARATGDQTGPNPGVESEDVNPAAQEEIPESQEVNPAAQEEVPESQDVNPPAQEETEAQEEIQSGTCGENLTWNFDEGSGTLTISGTGKMEDYISKDAPWKDIANDIHVVTIEDGVTSVGSRAFWYDDTLNSVRIPDSVTVIGDSAFLRCISLKELSLPSGLTEIGSQAFSLCKGLEKVTLPEQLVRIGERAFLGCSALGEIRIPDSVTEIEAYAFSECSSLREVTLPKNLTEIQAYMFWYCTSLERMTLPEGLVRIGGGAFLRCTGLKEIQIPDTVTEIGEIAFFECNSLEEMVFPEKLTQINDRMFMNCFSLKKVVLPEDLTSIGDGAFWRCSGLKELTLPSGIEEIGANAFAECRGLTKMELPSGLTNLSAEIFMECEALKEVTIPDSVTRIEYDAFAGCASLPVVEIPAFVSRIDGGAFRGCRSLASVYFMGGSPEMNSIRDAEYWKLDPIDPFFEVTADVYYTEGPSWNTDTMKDYGGTLTWMRRLYIIAKEAGAEVTDKVYVVGSGSGAVIKCSGAVEDFVSVAIDGNLLDPSYYTVESGSTVLTILSAFLDKLPAGDHTVTLNYTYASVDTVLTVVEKKVETPSEKPGEDTKPTEGQTTGTGNTNQQTGPRKSPQTGERTEGTPWPFLAACICVGGMAVLKWKKKSA
ncbi:MAG: leucine-rich repeat protein [Lachnospiraceae bacterium]|nr:leucine-rich repeat protein [Lachnospiraceae bacterium]